MQRIVNGSCPAEDDEEQKVQRAFFFYLVGKHIVPVRAPNIRTASAQALRSVAGDQLVHVCTEHSAKFQHGANLDSRNNSSGVSQPT